MPIRTRPSLSALVVLLAFAGCTKNRPPPPEARENGGVASEGGTAPAESPKKEPSMTAFPRIHWAFVAADLDAVTRAKTPADHHALPRTVFVPLGEPARGDPARKVRPFLIAREAMVNVAEDGAEVPPRLFTAFPQSGPPCIGKANRRVVLDDVVEGGSPDLEKGVVLDGCPPSPNAYAMFVVEGAHANAKKIEAAALPPNEHPGWAGGAPVRGAYRFAGAELVAVVRDVERDGAALSSIRVGSSAKLIGTADVPRDFDPPVLFSVGDHTLVVVGGVVLGVDRDGLVRVQERRPRR